MFILVVNAGSSSLKYQLFDMDKEQVLAKGLCERIGIDGAIKHQNLVNDKVYKAEISMPTHNEATRAMIDALLDSEYGVIKDVSDISAIGHRVVQGGPWLTKPTLVTDETIKTLERCIDLAPLHTKPHLQGIAGCKAVMPNTPMVAVFDTAFHQTMPASSFIYALPYEVYEQYKVRRYGFHGTSHKFVAEQAAIMMNKPLKDIKLITCHLGNGSSITAIKDGKVLDTTMGLTPLEGVPMGTRSGDLDPAILEFLMAKLDMNIAQITNYLNKKSGILGISGISSDFRDLIAASKEGNERAALALDVFCYRVRKYIGAYAAAMGGVDAIVFTAGVGENNSGLRKKIMTGMEYLGFIIDDAKNENGKDAFVMTADSSKVTGFVIPTNEELMIARDTKALCE